MMSNKIQGKCFKSTISKLAMFVVCYYFLLKEMLVYSSAMSSLWGGIKAWFEFVKREKFLVNSPLFWFGDSYNWGFYFDAL